MTQIITCETAACARARNLIILDLKETAVYKIFSKFRFYDEKKIYYRKN